MNRRIVTAQHEAVVKEAAPDLDGYFDRLVKYIPADIVAAWIAVIGLVATAQDVPKTTILWVAFVIGVILTGGWTYKQTGKPAAKTQILISSCSFVVWVFALGEPFASMSFYRPLYGSLLLILYSLVVGFLIPKE
jgi:hypothetical protein